jgi:predicted NBD/HSP70 family sugar kinase
VVQAAGQGDSVALGALQEVGERLGVGVANLVNVFNPELIVLGGALNLASTILLPIVERLIRENALTPACENVRVSASAHGIDACLMGAVALVLDDILREPISA